MSHRKTHTTVGLVGAGGISHVHLPGWLSLGYDVVVYSLDGLAPVITAQYGGEAVSSFDELLERSSIVDVCTPTYTHRELVESAAAAGKHVVCEKPLALTVADCEAMIDACERAGVRLFPGHVVRYFPAYTTLHDAVARGSLGDLAVLRFARMGAKPRQAWFFDTVLSGGIAVDQMIHDFDFARWVAGPITRVHAAQSGRVGTDEPVTVHAIMTHDSGAITHVNGVWGNSALPFRTTFEVAGTGGVAEHDSLDHPILTFRGATDAQETGYLPPVDPSASPYTAELADFAQAIANGSESRVTAQDGVEAVRLGCAVNESLRTGLPITLTQGTQQQ